MKFKCKLKYFWDGFKQGLIFSRDFEFGNYCPHCCHHITEDEYAEFTCFTLGCKYCRDEKVFEEFLNHGYTTRVTMEMSHRLKKLEVK